MARRRRFERTLLQPECVANIGGRLREIFLVAVTLRIDRLMTDRAAFLALSARAHPSRVNKAIGSPPSRGHHIYVKVMRKMDRELRYSTCPFFALVKYLSRIWERVPCTVTRARIRMAYRAYGRRRTAKELLAVTVDAGGMLWIVGYIGKSIITLADRLPIR